MLRRISALILVIALAVPAAIGLAVPAGIASPHATESPCVPDMSAMHHVGADHRQRCDHGRPGHEPAGGHGCIGCIAPIAQLPFAFTAPAMIGLPQPRWIAHALPSVHSGPETPPPRQS